MLQDPQARERAVGVWFLGREDKDQREAVRRDLLEQAKIDLEGLQADADEARELAATYLDAFETLLQ